MSSELLIRKARSLRLQAGRSPPPAARQLTALAELYESEARQLAAHAANAVVAAEAAVSRPSRGLVCRGRSG
jgi:hypothetical protein